MTDAAILKRLKSIRSASRALRSASTANKNSVLTRVAELLSQKSGTILKANAQDLKKLGKSTPAFRDRLTLDPTRLAQMGESLRQVAALPDPVGEQVERKGLANGLEASRIRSPLGVILMIFESRPNVAVEAFSLGFKAGNAMILRGGKESMRTTEALYKIIHEALEENHFPADVLWGIGDSDRKIPAKLLDLPEWIDVVVPRGGDSLIKFVTESSRIPIIKNDRGMCHVYVHEDADLKMAADIVENAKTQRPGVCNAMETLLVHKSQAEKLLPGLQERLARKGVEWFVCPASAKILKGKSGVKKATSKNWDTEYLDLKLNCRIVDSLEQAIEHIEQHGSRHSEAIITRSPDAARKFQTEVDAAAVYWNASTRFTDGFEFGLGGELGISTQKLHVRGPVGLRELTSVRYILTGYGQVRK